METKDSSLEKMKAKFDDLNYKWNIERNKLEAKAQNAKVEVRRKFEEQLKTLQKRRDPTLIRCLHRLPKPFGLFAPDRQSSPTLAFTK